MNSTLYHYPSLSYAPIAYPPYYRNEAAERKEAPIVPKNVMYTTAVEPKFIEHLLQHKGMTVRIATTVGKLEGTLGDVFIDHVALVVHGKTHHIRICQMVYFEKADD